MIGKRIRLIHTLLYFMTIHIYSSVHVSSSTCMNSQILFWRIQVSFLFSSKQKHSRCPVFKGSNISRVYIISQNKNGLLSKLTFSWGSLFFGYAPTSRLASLLGTGDGPGACASLTLFLPLLPQLLTLAPSLALSQTVGLSYVSPAGYSVPWRLLWYWRFP